MLIALEELKEKIEHHFRLRSLALRIIIVRYKGWADQMGKNTGIGEYVAALTPFASGGSGFSTFFFCWRVLEIFPFSLNLLYSWSICKLSSFSSPPPPQRMKNNANARGRWISEATVCGACNYGRMAVAYLHRGIAHSLLIAACGRTRIKLDVCVLSI